MIARVPFDFLYLILTLCVSSIITFVGIVSVRLSGSITSHEGRVEVLVYGIWGTFCSNGWDMNDANIVCRELGFNKALEIVENTQRFGKSSGFVQLGNMRCSNETSIKYCSFDVVEAHECDTVVDPGVSCGTGKCFHTE